MPIDSWNEALLWLLLLSYPHSLSLSFSFGAVDARCENNPQLLPFGFNLINKLDSLPKLKTI